MADQSTIVPGQVWADRQAGQMGRTVEVLPDPPKDSGSVWVRTLTPTEFSAQIDGGKKAVGRRTSIQVATLRKCFGLDWAATKKLAAERKEIAEQAQTMLDEIAEQAQTMLDEKTGSAADQRRADIEFLRMIADDLEGEGQHGVEGQVKELRRIANGLWQLPLDDAVIKIVKRSEWGDGTFALMGFDEDDRIEAGDDVRITVIVEVTE